PSMLRSGSDLPPFLRSLLAERFKLKAHTETRELAVSVLTIARRDGKLGPDMKPSASDCAGKQGELQRRVAEALQKGPGGLVGIMPKPDEKTPCSMTPLPPTSPTSGMGMRADGQPMNVIVAMAAQATGKIVKDETGLAGFYDWELHFDPMSMLAAVSRFGVTLPAGVNLPPSD